MLNRLRTHARYRVDQALRTRGLAITTWDEQTRLTNFSLADIPADWHRTMEYVRAYTLASPERVAGTIAAVAHVGRANVLGAFVECGVWRGGNSMAAALTLLEAGDSRDLWLYDTFEGMSAPTARDVDLKGVSELEAWDPVAAMSRGATLGDVMAAMESTGYPMQQVRCVKGRVEETIPDSVPDAIAVLRLDTDWYESTRHELEHLYPRLSVGGLLIIDDYGHYAGARQAVDEYFAEDPVYLARLDYTGRVAVKH